jgi:hypothetical protein
MVPSAGAAGGFQAPAPPTTSSSRASAQIRVTRPAPPLQRAPGGVPRHNVFVFSTSPFLFFGPSLLYPYGLSYGFGPLYAFGSPYTFGWPYPFASPYAFGAPYGLGVPYESAAPGPAAAPIYAPFYCSLDGLAFQDEAMFARHLHDAHGVPSENSLSYAQSVGGGRYVFFGF